MRALSFSVQKHGINRQRIKAGAKAEQLYDLVNGFITGSKSVVQRDGTVRDATLSENTRGLTAFDGLLQTFSDQFEHDTPVGYLANVLAHPTNDTATLVRIHFAQPFMNALYVVAEWSDGEGFHYWLASSGEWEANKVYFEGDVVTPTTPNGLLYKAVPHNPVVDGLQTWQPLTNYNVGDRVLPTTYNGYYFEVTETAGDVPISGPTEPVWNANEGAPTTEATDASGTPAANASADSAPSVPPDVRDRYGTGQTTLSEAATAAVGLSDTIPLWSPGTVYQPGDLVKPRSVAPVLSSDIPNANFELGDMNWTKDTGWTIINTVGTGKADKAYQGSYYGAFTPQPSGVVGYIKMATTVPVVPGQFIQASCYGAQNDTNNPNTNTVIVLLWYDEYDNLVKETEGTTYGTDSAKDYRIYQVQDTTPGDATKMKVGFKAWRNAGSSPHVVSVDSFAWNYVNLAPSEADFTTYQAVQAAAGTSGASEPVWPGAGNTVVDNQVTWLGGVNSVITWTAYPIMKSGSTEPDWVEQVGAASPDNTISWTATTGLVEQAPQSKIVVLGAKKVFAADGDIVRYSATVNPLDWTTEDDAGYLPTGLNTYGANPVAAMGLYRGNLMVYNSGGFQMWQIDEDPELMQLLDAVPVGSTYHHALQSVKNDQILLTELGYRNVSIAGGSTNLQAGDFGQPIDPLVQEQLHAGTYEPNSFYYPAQGQYWGIFGPQVFVCTFNDEGHSWGRYEFPEAITDATLLDTSLYLRTATHKVWRVAPGALLDDLGAPSTVGWETTFAGVGGGNQSMGPDTMRQPVLAAHLAAGPEIRLTFEAGNAGMTISAATVGLQATSGEPYAFASTPAVITFDGATSIALAGHGVAVSDPIALTIPAARNAIVAMYITGAGELTAFSGGTTGTVTYIKGGNDTMTVAASGYSSFTFDTSISIKMVEVAFEVPPTPPIPFDGVVWWPSLDLGSMGQNKQLDSFDLVVRGEVTVQFGYDQRDPGVLTDGYILDGDTLPGTSIPFPLSGPSFAPKLTFAGSIEAASVTGAQPWEWLATNLYIQDSQSTGFAG